MKQLVKKLFYFLPLFLILVLTNFFVDPFDMFHPIGDDDRWIVEQLVQGRNVLYYGNWDQRLVQKGYIEEMGERKKDFDVVVIGSSRALQIHPGMFPGKIFFNSSVTGAGLEDAIAIMQLYKKNHVGTETVIVGVDPWMFNVKNELEDWHVIESSYNDFLKDFFHVSLFDRYRTLMHQSGTLEIRKKVKLLFSLRYFQDSVKKKDTAFVSQQHKIVGSVYQEQPVKASDGSVVNSRELREKSPEGVLGDVKEYMAKGKLYGMDSFVEIDGDLQKQFDVWLKSLQDDGVHPIVFLPPYHPYTYDFMTSGLTYLIILDVEKHIRDVCAELGIPVVGSYNSREAGLTNQDFYDFMHPRREAVERLFAESSLTTNKE